MPRIFEAPPGFVLNPDYLVPELRAQRDALLGLLKEARKIIRASSSRNLAQPRQGLGSAHDRRHQGGGGEHMSKHTPGPWVVGNQDPLNFGVRRGQGTEPIGFVYGPSFPERSEVGQRALADARLIAAAPLLYEALQDLCDTLGECGMTEKARAAIKAVEENT